MARRPRSHQIEDISVRRFEDALPSNWVSRAITPDYGVDREVEIFTSSNESTGIKFAVQLKATDNAHCADRVRLKVSQLDYMLDYDLPSIVVRYDAGADLLRWQWAMLIGGRTSLKQGQKSFTYRFEAIDIWDEATPSTIERVLRARRALMSFPASAAMPVRLEIAEAISDKRYPIERVVQKIIAGSSGTLVAANAESAEVEFLIRVRKDFLSVGFEVLGGVTFDLDVDQSDRLGAAILYAMAFVFARKRMPVHARAAGRSILDNRHVSNHAALTARASYAFADDALAQAELAILNGLHRADSVYYPIVLKKLIETGKRGGGPEAVSNFLAAALEAADNDATQMAAIHYSTANALRADQPSRALFHYNRARHLRPAYLKADYFVGELAGTLFNVRRYVCSGRAYSQAIAIAPSDRLQLCLGDALFHCGDLEAASHCFKVASESEIAQIFEEAVVKLELCRMLTECHGARIPADWSRPIDEASPGADERSVWSQHLATINGLDPLAHFNLGVSDAKLNDYASALGHFVAAAVIQPKDVEAWGNAIICAFRSEEFSLVVILLHLAINLAGLDAYDSLRINLASQGAEQTLLAELDRLAMAADARPNPAIPGHITQRFLDGDNAIVIGD